MDFKNGWTKFLQKKLVFIIYVVRSDDRNLIYIYITSLIKSKRFILSGEQLSVHFTVIFRR